MQAKESFINSKPNSALKQIFPFLIITKYGYTKMKDRISNKFKGTAVVGTP